MNAGSRKGSLRSDDRKCVCASQARERVTICQYTKGVLFCQKCYIKGAIKNFVGSSDWSYDQKQSQS